MPQPITVGMSACLLGANVRYDGNHERHDLCLRLADHFRIRAICPEVSIGMSVPRPAIKLIGSPAAPMAIGKSDPTLNPTLALRALGQQIAAHARLSGFVVKSRSPSCGLGSTKVWQNDTAFLPGTGLFTAELLANATFPVIEETALNSETALQSFIQAVTEFAQHTTHEVSHAQ